MTKENAGSVAESIPVFAVYGFAEIHGRRALEARAFLKRSDHSFSLELGAVSVKHLPDAVHVLPTCALLARTI